MRKIFTLCAAALCAISTMATKGALNGKFTINAEGDQIVFSKGNLQYVGTWQFATNQWDTIGVAQSDNNRDLFGWGTGDAPNNISGSVLDYPSFTDWGVNPITNGGNVANAWRTLTGDEWSYLFYTRKNACFLTTGYFPQVHLSLPARRLAWKTMETITSTPIITTFLTIPILLNNG